MAVAIAYLGGVRPDFGFDELGGIRLAASCSIAHGQFMRCVPAGGERGNHAGIAQWQSYTGPTVA